MADFIRQVLITKIKDQIKEKETILKFDGFFFFDKDIKDIRTINRLNRNSLYLKEELMPLSWYQVKGTSLLDAYSQLKDNKFYIYKILEGKQHKLRMKNRNGRSI